MMGRCRKTMGRAQRGVTMLVVLVLMSVMLVGALALARFAEVSTIASGNAAWHDAALQASEVGLNTAYAAVKALTNDSVVVGTWYTPVATTKDSDGLPSGLDWSATPEIVVGTMSVRYYAERACTVASVSNALRDCLVKFVPQKDSYSSDKEKLNPPNSKQYRITVRVTGPKGTQMFVQSLVTKGT